MLSTVAGGHSNWTILIWSVHYHLPIRNSKHFIAWSIYRLIPSDYFPDRLLSRKANNDSMSRAPLCLATGTPCSNSIRVGNPGTSYRSANRICFVASNIAICEFHQRISVRNMESWYLCSLQGKEVSIVWMKVHNGPTPISEA
jgi:hypothetical protein